MTRRWLVVAMFACSGSKPEHRAVVGSEPPPPATPDAEAATPDADALAGYPERLVRPADDCTLRGAWKDQPEGVSLVPGGKPYAVILGVQEAEVTLGANAYAELTTPTIDVAGFVDIAQLQLHAARAFVVGDYAVPGPKLALRHRANKDGKLAFELPLPSTVKAKAPLVGEQPCAALDLDDAAGFDPHAAIATSAQGDAYIHANRAVPLSIELGKPPVAELRYETSPKVEVLEQKDRSARVAIEINSLNPADHVVLFGWIPASALHHAAHGFGGSWATGGARGARRGRPLKDTRFVSCTHETPLVVDFEGQRRTVGTIAPNVVIEVLPGAEDFVAVRFPRPNAELAEGARWLVKQAALAGCAAVAAP